ncbi:hypothetical protein [Salidesulfovibrio brasiliensis]|uniref:hypothetical protein n=1 Tax=Salidesulfovibrio brasiliensis TaxID=221711 RepID=UPI0012EDCCC5|nr:hypothetical protein [Salidesulfovibrio brasiliensis]
MRKTIWVFILLSAALILYSQNALLMTIVDNAKQISPVVAGKINLCNEKKFTTSFEPVYFGNYAFVLASKEHQLDDALQSIGVAFSVSIYKNDRLIVNRRITGDDHAYSRYKSGKLTYHHLVEFEYSMLDLFADYRLEIDTTTPCSGNDEAIIIYEVRSAYTL